MRSRRWLYLLLTGWALGLAGLYYYTAIWRHRTIVEDWRASPVYSLPDHGQGFDPSLLGSLPALEAGETYLIVRIRRRMNDSPMDPDKIGMLLPDGNIAELIAWPCTRHDAEGRRIIELAFVVRLTHVANGGLRLKYLDEEPVDLPTTAPAP